MKRILSLVLALVLVLGSVPMTFAADQSAGEMLKAAGFVAGDQDGNLNEDQQLTREQMMVLIAEMNGVKEEAATFGIPADFSDVNENDWFAPYVWYAFYQGWTTGMGDGTFGAGKAVDSKMAATFMLKALGYEVADYNASVEQAAGVGIEVAETSEMTRGEGFTAMWSTVNLPKEGSDVALGVELGKIEAPEEVVAELDVEIDEATAVGTSVVDVVFTGDVDADDAEAADLTIVKKGTSEELDIERIQAVASDRVYVYTAEMKAGTAFTVVLGDSTYNFTAVTKETDKPEVDSLTGTDTNLVEVEFDSNVDWDTATDVANYSIDKEGTVVAAVVKDDYTTVELTLEGITKRQSLKMTVENVLNVDGVMMDKETKTFYPEEDKDAPEIEEVNPEKLDNNYEVVIYFDDEHGVDKETAEDVSNYAVEGVEILKAETDDVYWTGSAEADTDNDYLNKVTLTTSGMDASDKYEVKVLYMVDGSTSANATTDTLSETFRAGSEDDDEPSLKSAEALSETIVKVVMDDKNDLDPVTALDVSNYSFEDDELSVYDVMFKDDDEEEMTLYLTVSRMEEDENYTLQVNNVADVYGNTMEDEDEDTFDLDDVNYNGASAVEKVIVVDLETIEVYFTDSVKGDSAEDPTNYVIDGEGSALSAEFLEDSNGNELDYAVLLEVNELGANDEYTLVINGIENFTGNTTDDYEYDFIATSDEQDTEKPEVDDVSIEQGGVLLVEFSEDMEITGGVWDRDLPAGQAALPAGTAYLTATVTGLDASGTPAGILVNDVITFVATDTTDDGQTVIFNAYQAYHAATLTQLVTTDGAEIEFDITSFSGVTDEAGNVPDYDAGDEEFVVDELWTPQTTTVNSTVVKDDGDNVEYDSADQESSDTVNVYFDENVRVYNTGSVTPMNLYLDSNDDGVRSWTDSDSDGLYDTGEAYTESTAKYTVTVDDDDDETLIVLELSSTSKKYFEEDEELVMNDIENYVVDMIGRPVKTEDIAFDTDDEDTDEPDVDSVVAINNRQVEITWNMDLSSADYGKYEIVNKDNDEWNGSSDTAKSADFDLDLDDNVVTITLDSLKFNADDDFELVIVSDVDSLFGVSSDLEDEDYSFGGNSTPYAGNPITGVTYINGTTIEISDDDDFKANDDLKSIVASKGDVKNTVVYATAWPSTAAARIADDTHKVVVKEYTPFLDGTTYTVTMTLDAVRDLDDDSAHDDMVVGTIQGTVEYLEDVTTAASASVAGIDIDVDDLDDDSDYTYVLYTANAAADFASSSATVTATATFTTSSTFAANGVELDGEVVTIATASLGATANYGVVVVKDGTNVQFVSAVFQLK